MATFWSTEPIEALQQSSGSYPYGLYPAIRYFNGVHPAMNRQADKMPYNRALLEEMVRWCMKSCKGSMTYSEKDGSLFFELAEDRAIFRVFFDTMNLPTPTVVI